MICKDFVQCKFSVLFLQIFCAPYPMILGQNIRFIRKQLKLSQAKFAQYFDVTRAMIGYYEVGKANPSIEFLLKLEEISGYSFKEICTKNLQEDVQKIGTAKNIALEDPIGYKSKVDERLDYIEAFLKKKHIDF
ncbi:MAG: XRE family transcriptional regulator [Caulobacteraceae bacterium]|nr:XRE family transcriptional regulator [Caulobacteraceae bacterium]